MKPLMIGMAVFEGRDGDKILKQTPLNFNDPNARRLIAKTARWAMNNGHELVTWPLEPGEKIDKIDSREES